MGGPYSQTLLDHARHPRNHGPLASPAVSQEATNPLCGDRVRVQLAIQFAFGAIDDVRQDHQP